MVPLYLIAVATCKLLAPVKSTRIGRGLAHTFTRPEHAIHADMTSVVAAAAAVEEALLACQVVGTKHRFAIQAKDKPFWDYVYSRLNYLTDSSLKPQELACKTYAPPPKSSSSFKNLSIATIPEDAVGYDREVICDPCALVGFNTTFLSRCSTPTNAVEFLKVHKEVQQEGGSCTLKWFSERERTLSNCMRAPKDPSLNHYSLRSMLLSTSCLFQSDSKALTFIQEQEGAITKTELEIQGHQELIKAKQTKIQRLQSVLDVRKQHVTYLKQVFDGM